ncbi:MAG: SDR family oxidoreductase, partial [Candidatus Nanopelagicales bacterium]|nr:SDR family oxidoreductase [Candidatus Nanopelagicales bacterium]
MTPPWLSLEGKRAVITGAGSPTGIGFACATALLELGADVAVLATGDHVHGRVRELAGSGYVRGYVGNLTNPEETQEVFEAIA